MSLARFSVKNPVTINLLMWTIILSGIYYWFDLTREFFPTSAPEQIALQVNYPGAPPEDVEKSVTRRMEREIEDVDNIKRITSQAFEGTTIITLELETGSDKEKFLNDLRGEIDKVKGELPEETEEPEIIEVRPFIPVLSLVLYGDVTESKLHQTATRVRDDLLDMPEISEVFLSGLRDPEIWIEVDHEKLQEYNLSFVQIGTAVGSNNLDLPGGQLQDERNTIRVRTIGEKNRAREIEEIIILTGSNGHALHLRDIAKVKETFEDRAEQGKFAGKRACSITVLKAPEQDALEIAEKVKKYLEQTPSLLHGAIKAQIVTNFSRFISQRLDLMLRNARIGFLLVIIVLLLFLDLRVTFWVAAGLPTAFLGTFTFMSFMGITVNLISLFALILVLGLIVDDAIIVGENIFSKIQEGYDGDKAAIYGAEEVTMPVIAAVLTTIVAFLPLGFIEGRTGTILAEMPYVVIAALSMSLVEVLLILPSHLSHDKKPEEKTSHKLKQRFLAIEQRKQQFFEKTLPTWFEKVICQAVRWRYIGVCLIIFFSMLVCSLIVAGVIPFVFIQKVDAENVAIDLEMMAGTPEERTLEVLTKIESKVLEFPEVAAVFSVLGTAFSEKGRESFADPATIGQLTVELLPASERQNKMRSSQEFIEELRQRVGVIKGAKKFSLEARSGGPQGPDIELLIRGKNLEQLQAALSYVRDKLSSYQGVYEIEDNLTIGKQEIKVTLLPVARFMDISTQDLALQLRHALFGFEIQRLQENDDEIIIRTLLPKKDTQTLADLSQLRIQTSTGKKVPLEEIAHLHLARGYSSIYRVDGKRAAKLQATVNESVANISEISSDLEQQLANISKQFPGIKVLFEGQKKQVRESLGSLAIGFPVALLLIYAIIAILFRSYIQPIIIMIVIPFSIVGAIIGHLVLFFPFTFLSMVGCVALAGIVVNDSLILVNLINMLREKTTHCLQEIVIAAAKKRLRAILLTTITTVAGLTPLMLETSFQAQFLIPMAISLVFGLLFATVLTLVFIPLLYLILEDILNLYQKTWEMGKRLGKWAWEGSDSLAK